MFGNKDLSLSYSVSVGNAISISELRADVVSAYRQEVDWNTNETLRPYKKMFERRKVWSQDFPFLFCFLKILKYPKWCNIGASRDSGAGVARSCGCDSRRDCWNQSHQTRYRNVSSRILLKKDRYVFYDRHCCSKILHSLCSLKGEASVRASF